MDLPHPALWNFSFSPWMLLSRPSFWIALPARAPGSLSQSIWRPDVQEWRIEVSSPSLPEAKDAGPIYEGSFRTGTPEWGRAQGNYILPQDCSKVKSKDEGPQF